MPFRPSRQYKYFDLLSQYQYTFPMKPLIFHGDSQDDLRSFPAEARRECGYQLNRVQAGLMPADCKPMLSAGKGVYEIRVHVLGEWRVIYVARFNDAVHVLHAFQKKTQRTSKEDVALARNRYRDIGA
jgi:phage-related protein